MQKPRECLVKDEGDEKFMSTGPGMIKTLDLIRWKQIYQIGK